jgi:hypothetical protein
LTGRQTGRRERATTQPKLKNMTPEDRLKKLESLIPPLMAISAHTGEFLVSSANDYLCLAKAMMLMKQVQTSLLKLFSISPLMHEELKPEIQKIVALAETADEHIEAAAAVFESKLAFLKSIYKTPPPATPPPTNPPAG